MIAADWGSTNFRAALLDDRGSVIDRISSDDGIKKHRSGQSFEDTLFRLCGDWIANDHVDSDVYLSGMVGSREGWIEVPYVKTVCGPSDLAEALTEVPSEKLPGPTRIWIVPGVSHDLGRKGNTDVMRGEETEVIGLLSKEGISNAVVCIPGTHSKWIECSNGKIEAFQTWLTGEAFERLTKDSLLSGGETTESIDDDSAFFRGLDRSGQTGGLLHHLFLGRTDMLMKHITPESLPSLISGLLIGHEIRDATKISGQTQLVHLIGKTKAARSYAKAFEWFGIEFASCEEDVHTLGILEIAACR